MWAFSGLMLFCQFLEKCGFELLRNLKKNIFQKNYSLKFKFTRKISKNSIQENYNQTNELKSGILTPLHYDHHRRVAGSLFITKPNLSLIYKPFEIVQQHKKKNLPLFVFTTKFHRLMSGGIVATFGFLFTCLSPHAVQLNIQCQESEIACLFKMYIKCSLV